MLAASQETQQLMQDMTMQEAEHERRFSKLNEQVCSSQDAMSKVLDEAILGKKKNELLQKALSEC